ncbi:hypothetical protein [Anaeromyxobacter paludicola]|uniref:Secreted protein n=1 Tax=Anaeromyxobacter paludicola TaxID=2918171 RepID=A0ABN6N7S1_9BACT|nr:hypothetical protein [Anaeromyxobacter paludicola]BDG09242.1 hypothetical protein AMPC_23550 [Anaeromyxobacter paludicola]
MRTVRRWTLALGAGAILALLAPAARAAPGAKAAKAGPARAGPADWQQEFADVCSKTQDAMTLSEPELRSLVTRCDALEPRLEALEESGRKVWLKRLQLCRDLYQFVLETKEQERKDKS